MHTYLNLSCRGGSYGCRGLPRLGTTDEPAKIAPEIDPQSTQPSDLAPGRFSTPTQVDFGSILDLSWAVFGQFFGAILASSFKIVLDLIFGRFLIDLRPSRSPKTLKKPMVFEHFCFFCLFACETDSGPILGRFWIPKSTQNRSRKGLQRC